MKSQGGITLAEVVVVVAIISVLCGFAAPVLENLKSTAALRAEIASLVSNLHKARCVAIRNNESVVFSYTTSGYKIFVDDGSGGGQKEDWIQQSGEQVLSDITFDKGLSIDLAESTFTSQATRFSGSPGVNAGAVVLRKRGGKRTKVVVNSIGRVRVERL